jgi:hypothetical protein
VLVLPRAGAEDDHGRDGLLRGPRAWFNTISISGYHPRGGSTAAQELAFTLANGMEYVRRGVAPC